MACFSRSNITNQCFEGASSVQSFKTNSFAHVLLNCPKEAEDWGIDATYSSANGCRKLAYNGRNFTGVSIDGLFFAREQDDSNGNSSIPNTMMSLAMIALMIGPLLLVLIGRLMWIRLRSVGTDEDAKIAKDMEVFEESK